MPFILNKRYFNDDQMKYTWLQSRIKKKINDKTHIKAESPQEGILFCTQFSSLGIFINKKIGNRQN